MILGTLGFKAHRDCFKQNKNINETNLNITESVESKEQLLEQLCFKQKTLNEKQKINV